MPDSVEINMIIYQIFVNRCAVLSGINIHPNKDKDIASKILIPIAVAKNSYRLQE